MNLNDTVMVVLTEIGAKIMNAREKYCENAIQNYKARTYKEGQEVNTQLWCLFEIFGEYIHITCKPPFKNNEILTIRKDNQG